MSVEVSLPAPPPSATHSGPAAGDGVGAMLKADHFVKLLIAQMKYQDPTKPMETGEMMAQLGQVSQVQQGAEMSRNLVLMRESLAFAQLTQISHWAGREVEAESPVGSCELEAGKGSARLAYRLEGAAEELRAEIYAPDGQRVRRLVLVGEPLDGKQGGGLSAGAHTMSWDGRDEDGRPLPAGRYSIALQAFDREQRSVPTWAETRGRVEAVEVVDGRPKLRMDGAQIDPSKVRRFHPQ